MSIILDGTKGETFPSWTTGTRPATPNTGQTGYNTTLATLEVYSGTAWTPIVTTARAGTVLQVVQTVTNSYVSTTSSTLVDATGFSVSITPTSATNKILVLVSLNGVTKTTANGGVWTALIRNSTNISNIDYAGNTGTGSTSYGSSGVSFSYLDSPASTSSTTYKIQYAAVSGVTAYINNYIALGNTYSSITAMEIAA